MVFPLKVEEDKKKTKGQGIQLKITIDITNWIEGNYKQVVSIFH
jgi:hypothetical protein